MYHTKGTSVRVTLKVSLKHTLHVMYINSKEDNQNIRFHYSIKCLTETKTVLTHTTRVLHFGMTP
jgi:predicted DNA-binding ArsR family transcriptional regulator